MAMICMSNMFSLITFLAVFTGFLLDCSSKIVIVKNNSLPEEINESWTTNAGDNITLNCSDTAGSVYWRNKTNKFLEECSQDKHYCTLKIQDAQYNDTGYYVCTLNETLTDEKVYLYFKDEKHLFVNDSTLTVQGIQGGTVTIPCRTTAPDITVELNKGSKKNALNNLARTMNINIQYNPMIGFTVTNIAIALHGTDYTCSAIHGDSSQKMFVNLVVYENTTSAPVPEIDINDVKYIGVGENIVISCKIRVSIEHRNYSLIWSYPNKGNDKTGHIEERNFNVLLDKSGYERKLTITGARKEDSGNYTCIVNDHNKNQNNKTKTLHVCENGCLYLVRRAKENFTIPAGEIAKWKAIARGYPKPKFMWFGPNGNEIINSTKFIITYKGPEECFFEIKNLSFLDSGVYRQVVQSGYKTESSIFTLKVMDRPNVELTSNNKLKHYIQNRSYEIYCNVTGYPKPELVWSYRKCNATGYCEDAKFENVTDPVNFTDYEYYKPWISTLKITATKNSEYNCWASNSKGADNKTIYIPVIDMEPNNVISKGIIAAIVILVIALGALAAVIIHRFQKERELDAAGLKNFSTGAVESLNKDLTLDEQAHLLPYHNDIWEFPRDKLKLGKQLGAGAFGVVMKAKAYGIEDGEESTTVAVKMVKEAADLTIVRALGMELKIMAHLGKNLNVVNLLGACTKNIAKRELLVIVEFCRFGNLHNYLIRHRDNFINQISDQTGEIDPSIGADTISRASFSNLKQRKAPLSFTFSNRSCKSDAGRESQAMSPNVYSKQSNSNFTHGSSSCMSPGGDDVALLSNNSAQPHWRSNMRGDYEPTHVQVVCTWDLLCWAFQVSRGMEYLTSRRVLHGDLAARNILLADDNVVKICDFGLARTMYKSENYKKKGEGPLPIKWMAIESIRDRVFSTQSDVWSFGIVLWEFFSLARSPYPGMGIDDMFFNKLLSGYRMECPKYSTQEIYKLMLDCWQERPNLRPTFTEISNHLGAMLGDSMQKHYIDLNDQYIAMNMKQFEDHIDYLSMMSSPTYSNLTVPNYKNDTLEKQDKSKVHSIIEEGEFSGYLTMKSPVLANNSSNFSPGAEKMTRDNFSFDRNSESEETFSDKDIKNSTASEVVSMSKNESLSGDKLVKNVNQVAPKEVNNTKEFESTKNPINKIRTFLNPQYINRASISSSLNKYAVKFKNSKGDTEDSDYLPMGDSATKNTDMSDDSGIFNKFNNPKHEGNINSNDNPYVNVTKN